MSPYSISSEGVTTTDPEGYSYSLSFNVSVGAATEDVADAPVGQAFMTVPVTGSFSVTNSTSGHDVSGDEADFDLIGFWRETSPLCRFNNYPSVPGYDLESVNLTSPSGAYCEVQVANLAVPSGTDLGVNETTDGTVTTYGHLGNSGTAISTAVKEAAYSGIAKAFDNGPVLWALASHQQYGDEMENGQSKKCTLGVAGGEDEVVWVSTGTLVC